MKAYCKCPNCGEGIESSCEACIEAGTVLHQCKGQNEPDVYDVEWEILED